MPTLFLYILLFLVCSLLLYNYQKSNKKVLAFKIGSIKTISTRNVAFVIKCLLCMTPIIIIYGLREGVGTDYYNYERIYNTVHNVPFNAYFGLHLINRGDYYIEVGYYLLNRLASSYHVLLTLAIILMFLVLFLTLKDFKDRINISLAVLIYLSTQFIYAMNSVRFAIALCFVFLSYRYILKEDFIRFTIFVFIAACFHKTALFCIALYFVQEFNQSYINKIRNTLMMIAILLFPFLSQYLFDTFKQLSVFRRYFSASVYAANESMDIGFGWLLHILPIIVPLIIFAWRYILEDSESRTLFRIFIMNIPFRMLGLYNTWYTRFARYSQVVEVIFIPLVVNRIENKKIKRFLTIYYVIWYIFYFGYYAIVNDAGDSLSYAWILSNK